MENFKPYMVLFAGFATVVVLVWIIKRVSRNIRARKKRITPTCFNCEFHTPYQMLNNRDERVDVNHCSVLSARIKSIHGNYIQDMAVSVNDPVTFSCNQHKQK